MIGAAYAMLVMVALSNLIRYLFLKSKYGMGPFTWPYLYVCLLLVTLYVADYFFPSSGVIWLESIIRTSIGLGLFLIIVYRSGWSKDFSEMIDGMLRFQRKS